MKLIFNGLEFDSENDLEPAQIIGEPRESACDIFDRAKNDKYSRGFLFLRGNLILRNNKLGVTIGTMKNENTNT